MKVMTPIDRITLLLTGLLAAYQVVVGVSDKDPLALVSYTVAFGVLLVAGLLLIILGFSILDAPSVAAVSSLIPLALSLGLITEHVPSAKVPYLVFAVLGFIAIVLAKFISAEKVGVLVLALVHGISGLVIFILPLFLSLQGTTPNRFVFVGVGGGLIGIGGILFSFLKTGNPLLDKKTIYRLLPGLLLMMTASFVWGFTAV
ncbi:MAG: hypothetical protein U5K99_00275 [Anaerolineales bacterium]|nr:hypothetical protein [Anaerolineales bacterium]